MATTTWDLIHAERHSLVDQLQSLKHQQWQTTSLCPQWNVHQVLAHLVALTKQTPPKFFGRFVASGFQFQKMVAKDIAREGGGTPSQTLAELAAHLSDTSAPPGPVNSWLGEVVVHGADIRRPLGLDYTPPVATTAMVADFYKNSNLLIGSKSRIAGLKLVATDTHWTDGTAQKCVDPSCFWYRR